MSLVQQTHLIQHPSTKGERSTMDSVEKNKVHDADDMIQSSSVLVPEGVPDETFKDSVIASGQEGTNVVGMEDKNESNAVGTSAGSSKPSSLYSSLQKTPATVIGTSTEKITESTAMATSTGGERAEGTSHSEKTMLPYRQFCFSTKEQRRNPSYSASSTDTDCPYTISQTQQKTLNKLKHLK